MTKPNDIMKFRGLVVQPNSFTVPEGSFEVASNVIIKYDNLIDKRRGYKDYHEFRTVDTVNNLFAFDGANFAVSATKLFQFHDTVSTSQCFCTASSATIMINERNHGLTHGTYIAEFNLPDSDPVTAEFASRQSAFYGSQQITSNLTVNGTRLSNTVTVSSNNHGLLNLDVITIVGTGTLGVAVTAKTITYVDANTFTITDAGLDASGTLIYNNPHAFTITVAQVALASATSGATAASYRTYTLQPGIAFTTTTVGKTRYVGTDYAGYFTSDQGLLKIDKAANPIYRAGIPQALDNSLALEKNSSGVANGPAKGNSQISYRCCFARKDANGILVVGAPGEQTTIINSPVVTYSLSVDAGTHVVTVTSTAHGLASTDKIYISSATCTGGTIIDGTEFFITKTGANTFTFDLDDQGLAAVTAIANLSFSYDMSVRMYITIPSELTTDYIVQIYRTNTSFNEDTTPDPRYFKIYEAQLVTADITREFVNFLDEQSALPQSGAEELYTNYTRDGEIQAANRPPRAKDIALYKGHLFYFNFETIQTLDLNLVNPDLISNSNTITIAGSTYIYRYNTGLESLGNQVVTKAVTVLTGVATVTAPNAFTAGDVIYVFGVTLVGITEGLYTILTAGATNFTFATGAGNATGTVTFEGRTNSTGNRLVKLYKAGITYSQAECIDFTARALVRAINRNTASTVYAVYASLVDDIPGKITLINKNIEDASFAVTASAGGQAYVPVLPTSGVTISSQNAVCEGEVMFSKYGEPEAVPYLNRMPVGSKNYEGFRIAALRDSIIFAKEDGIYRLNGDAPSNFSITILDNTTLCKSKESVAVLNNSVYMLANKGVVSVTDASVQIMSRPIEPLLTSIVGYQYIENVSSGVSYESERLYLLSTVKPVTALSTSLETSDVVYAYNYLTNSWTQWNYPFSRGFNNPTEDKLYFVSNNGENIYQERKTQNRLDYGDSQYAVPLRRNIICEAISITGSASLEVTSLVKHNLIAGDLITISNVNSALCPLFGITDVVSGLRFVTGILSEYTFTFDAGAVASGLVISDLYYNKGMSEANVVATMSAGSRTVVLTTSQAHGRLAGDNIKIESLSAAVAATLTHSYSMTGTRTILTVLSPTSFTVSIGEAPGSSASDTVQVTDNTQDFQWCTGLVKSGLQPQIGDILYSAPLMYRVIETHLFSNTRFVLKVGNPVRAITDTLSYLYSAYTATLKFTPIHGGQLGLSKKWTEFHASFRNSDACSGCNIMFASDSIQASSQIVWNARVGTDGATIGFNRWGHSPWGQFAWSEGITTSRVYETTPSIHVRTYIPREVSLGTYIQPEIIHTVAGEPFSLQSITVHTAQGSNRSTR